MTSLDPRQTLSLRDAVLSTALLAVPMALYRAQVEPSVLRIPGIALYIPFMVVYIVLGGETENDLGPLRRISVSTSSYSGLSSRQSRIWFGSGDRHRE